MEIEDRHAASRGDGSLDCGFRQAVGDNFQRGYHVAIFKQLIVLDTGQRNTLVNPVEVFQTLPVKSDKPPPGSIDVDAACRGR